MWVQAGADRTAAAEDRRATARDRRIAATDRDTDYAAREQAAVERAEIAQPRTPPNLGSDTWSGRCELVARNHQRG